MHSYAELYINKAAARAPTKQATPLTPNVKLSAPELYCTGTLVVVAAALAPGTLVAVPTGRVILLAVPVGPVEFLELPVG